MHLALLLLSLAQAPDAPKKSIAALLEADVNGFSTEGLQRVELQKLRFQLEDRRPGFTGSIAALSGGVVLDFLGLAGIVTSAITLSSSGNNEFKRVPDPFLGGGGLTGLGIMTVTIGVVGSLAGAALTWLGAHWLDGTLSQRKLAGFKLDLVDEALAKTP